MPIYDLKCSKCGKEKKDVFCREHVEVGDWVLTNGCHFCGEVQFIRPSVELTARQNKQWEAAVSGKKRTMVRGDYKKETPVKD